MNNQDIDNLKPFITKMSGDFVERFRGFVERADVEQAMWEWAVKSRSACAWARPVDDLNERYGNYAQLRTSLKRAAQAYCLREKAERSGFQMDDLYFYSSARIKDLLPLALTPLAERTLPGNGEQEIKGSGDPAEGGNLQVEILDITRALDAVNVTEREMDILRWHHLSRHTFVEMQHFLDEEHRGTVINNYLAVIKRIQQFLGGPDPAEFQVSGNRKSMSNAQALAITNGDYE